MRKLYLFILLFSHLVNSQNFTLSGYIEDINSGESLIGANVLIKGLDIGCSTNNYGFFSITIPQGDYTILSTYIGYETKSQNINVNENKSLIIYLNPELFEIKEDPEDVIIDFKHARVYDHSGLDAIQNIADRYNQYDKKLHLLNLSKECKSLLNKAENIVEVSIIKDLN